MVYDNLSKQSLHPFNREIEYLKKETQRCAQVGAEASLLKEESGQLQEQVRNIFMQPVRH